MSNHRRGSLSWHIAKLYEEQRQLQCATTYFGWPEPSEGHYANVSTKEIADIDAEFADAVRLLRELGLVQSAEPDEAAVEHRTVGGRNL